MEQEVPFSLKSGELTFSSKESITPLATRSQFGFNSASTRVQTERPESEGFSANFLPSSTSRSHLLNTYSKFKPNLITLPEVEPIKQLKQNKLENISTRTLKGKTKPRMDIRSQKQSERFLTEPVDDSKQQTIKDDYGMIRNCIKIRKKKVKRTKSEEKGSSKSIDTLNGLLSLNRDPLLANVLVPSLTTGNMPSPFLFDNFGYKFDAFRVNNIPPVLIQKNGS